MVIWQVIEDYSGPSLAVDSAPVDLTHCDEGLLHLEGPRTFLMCVAHLCILDAYGRHF